MKKNSYMFIISLIIFFVSANFLQSQTIESWDFESNTVGDTLDGIGWNATDVVPVVVDSSGNNVLEVTIKNYNAAPVLMFVLPDGKTLADYTSFTFKGYFAQGDVGYKDVRVEAFQTMPTIRFNSTDSSDTLIGKWNRALGGSTAWEDITVDITNSLSMEDTIYIAFGIHAAGTGDIGGTGLQTIWYADDVTIVGEETPAEDFIVVDAEKDDFYNTLTGPDDGYLQLKYYHGNDNGIASGNIDLSANVWAAWDSVWFYFYTEVTDDTLSGSGANSYEDDGLELKIDPVATTAGNTIVAPNLTIAAGSDSLSSFAVADSLKQWARKEVEGGYVLELAIAWDAIVSGTETITAGVDSVFGLAINIHDNDHPVGGTREHSIQWAAVLLDAVWNTNAYLGTVKFLPDNKLQFIPTNNFTPANTNPLPYDGPDFYVHIDGQRDRVFNGLTGPSNGYLRMRPFHASDNGTPESLADLSSSIWTAWDDEWFYYYQEVTDDSITAGTITAESYLVDNIELKFDPQATDSTQTGSGGASPSMFETRVTAPGITTPKYTLNNIADSLKQFVYRTTASGYAMEMAIKWDAIESSNGETISVDVDSLFGMAINVHDNDGAGREASITWAAVLLDAAWNTPKYLGTVTFLENNKLNFEATNNMTGVTNNLPYDGTTPDDVERDPDAGIPTQFSLSQNYPNPFNPTTTIEFSVPQNSDVRILLYDILGKVVGEIVQGNYDAGTYKAKFNASNLASGVYFYRLEAGNFSSVKKLMLMK